MTEIKNEFPPNYDAIFKAFKPGKHVVFAYDDAIYNPHNLLLREAIIEHEKVHLRQQKKHPGGAVGWWEDYIRDKYFRLRQEAEAHRQEYLVMMDKAINRHERRSAARIVAKKLASPLYGRLVAEKNALLYIKSGLMP